jgi:uncharacterized membrane protein YdjX (TVP38/TMEM64 family)
MSKHKNFKKVVIAILVILVLVGLFFLLRNHNILNRRVFRQFQKYILSFGIWAPLIIILMIILGTVIPPLPLPTPLIELTAGVVFGFWKGWFIIWFGQIISSFIAFGMVRFFNKTFVSKWLNNRRWDFYNDFLNRKGTSAILITRGTMTSPFNIISFLSGISSISPLSFLWATAVGVIPETVLYSLVGSQLRALHIRFVWLSAAVLIIGLVGFGVTFLTTAYLKSKFTSSPQKK